MIPVYQTLTIKNNGTGNCFNACVASILEMPLRDVCQVLPADQPYWDIWNDWLKPLGLKLKLFPRLSDAPKGWSIASGYSDRVYPEDHDYKPGERILHAVVAFDGEPVHDPFPNAKSFGDIRYYWALTPLENS